MELCEAVPTALDLDALRVAEEWNEPRESCSRLEAEERALMGLDPESVPLAIDHFDTLVTPRYLWKLLRHLPEYRAALAAQIGEA